MNIIVSLFILDSSDANCKFRFSAFLSQFRMDGHSFISALLYALIGLDTFVPKPLTLYALSLPPSSSLTSSQPDSLSPVTSLIDDQQKQQQQQPQHSEKTTTHSSKSRINNNNVGSSTNSNSIVTKSKQTCKLSEFMCPNGICIPLSRYCNGIPDCLPDKSDEPADCSGKFKLHTFTQHYSMTHTLLFV